MNCSLYLVAAATTLWSVATQSQARYDNFQEYCLAADLSPSEINTVEAMMIKMKVWPERNLTNCQVTLERLNAKDELNLFPDPFERPREKITDLRPVITLKHIKRLTLSWNAVEDLSTLKAMPQLEYLNLYHNAVVDLAAVSNLTQLRELHLADNNIQNLGPLSTLKRLEVLDISANAVSDLGPLANLKSLRFLYAGDNQIGRLDALASLVHLELLSIGGNSLEELGPLKALTKLQHLAVTNNRLRSVASLRGLPSLEIVDLRDNSLEDVLPLKQATRLRWLNLRNNQIRDLHPLAGLVNFTHLYLDKNRICQVPDEILALQSEHPNDEGKLIRTKLTGLDNQDLSLCP